MKPTTLTFFTPRLLVACVMLTLPRFAAAQSAIPPSITTPDKVETRIGTLDFKDGAPNAATVTKIYDNLDFTHAFEAFVNTMQGVSIEAIIKGMQGVGVKANEVIVFSQLMDAKSLFLTANADTIYFLGYLDLSNGPMVLEVPPKALGAIDDHWFRWVIDFGAPGPDRGEGGKYLILPPGYDGPLPEGGFFVARARTTRVLWFGRMFLENNDPKPAADLIKSRTKIYPYEAGGVGTPIAEFLAGKAKLGRIIPPPPTVFHEGSGVVMNTIPPSDFSYYEMLNDVVQEEPATSLDPELMGPLAAIGVIKSKPFAPDARMKKIITEALAVANATSRRSAVRAFYICTGRNFSCDKPATASMAIDPSRDTGCKATLRFEPPTSTLVPTPTPKPISPEAPTYSPASAPWGIPDAEPKTAQANLPPPLIPRSKPTVLMAPS